VADWSAICKSFENQKWTLGEIAVQI